MQKCRTYDGADAVNTQKKVSDYQKEYDEKNANKSASKSPGQGKITVPLNKKNKGK